MRPFGARALLLLLGVENVDTAAIQRTLPLLLKYQQDVERVAADLPK